MNEEQRIREETAQTIKQWHEETVDSYEHLADKILSIKGIIIEADNQDLPEQPTWFSLDGKAIRGAISVYQIAQQDMLTPEDGYVWVKCKVKEE